MQRHGVHPVIRHVDHPDAQRLCTVQVDAVDTDPKADDAPAVELLQGRRIEPRGGPGEDHVGPSGDFDHVLAGVPRTRNQLDLTEHLAFDVESVEPRSENRHLGPP